MKFDWYLPTRVIFGCGEISRLAGLIEELGAQRVLLATGASAMSRSGILGRVKNILSGCELEVFEGVPVNLPLEACDELIEAVRTSKAQAVVGLGGGSVLDGAKAAALFAPGGGSAADYLAGREPMPGLPFIAVPTTSGTSSEVTPSIIFLDRAKHRKLSYGRKEAMAKVALVDPELTVPLPPDQTASTGLDALSHCFEAYWSRLSNPVSDALALEAIEIIIQHLPEAYRSPENIEARTGMSYGSLCAGLSFSQTATAAVHGLTYPMTAHFGVPHGIACAFLLREIMAVNFHHLDQGKQIRLLHCLQSNTIQAAVDFLTDLFIVLDVPMTLADLEIPASEISRFTDEVTPINLERNIAPLNREKILELWKKKT